MLKIIRKEITIYKQYIKIEVIYVNIKLVFFLLLLQHFFKKIKKNK